MIEGLRFIRCDQPCKRCRQKMKALWLKSWSELYS